MHIIKELDKDESYKPQGKNVLFRTMKAEEKEVPVVFVREFVNSIWLFKWMYSLPSLKNSKCHNQSWQNKAGVEWIKTLQLKAFYIKRIKIKNEK